MNIPAEDGANQQERAILREWEYLQHSLFTFTLAIATKPASSRRLLIEDLITRSTRGCAQLWWAPYTNTHIAKNSQIFEVRYQHIRYGLLELAAGYLVSSNQPHIPQHFAQFCALIITLAEHEQFVQLQLTELSPLLTLGTMKPLSVRERDIVRGLRNTASHKQSIQGEGVRLRYRRAMRKAS